MVLQRGGSGVGVIRAPAWYSNGSRYLSRTNQAVNLLDDQFLELGTDQDAVLTLSKDAVVADAEVTGLIEGTSDHLGHAAKSIVISNINNNGDVHILVSKAGNSHTAFLADGSTGDTILNAPSGQSVDTYIAGTKEIDYSTGAMAFQQTTTISTTSGGLSIDLNDIGSLLNVGVSGNDWDSNGINIVIPTIAGATDNTKGVIVSNTNYPHAETIIGQFGGEPHLTMYTSGDTLSVRLGVAATCYSLQAIRIGADADDNAFDNAPNGSGTTTMHIGNEEIQTSSDERLKTAIRPTQANALDLVNRFNVVDFEWDDPTDTVEYGKNYRGRYTGMLAQETVKIAPWIINDQGGGRDCSECLAGQDCEEHGMWIVSYQNLVPTLVKAIQELSHELQEVRNGHN
jgi:hypothetical protein